MPFFQRFLFRGVLGSLVMGLTAFAHGETLPVVSSSSTVTHTPKPAASHRRPLKKIEEKIKNETKQLRQEIETHAHPNPAVQDPQPPFTQPPKLPLPETGAAPSGSERFIRGLANIMTKPWHNDLFIWLPAITTDPNSGVTLGFMPVLLLPEENSHRIRQLIAPLYTYNPIFGQTITGNYFLYPTNVSQFFTEGSISQRTNRDIEAHYQNNAFWGKVGTLAAEAGFTVDGSRRFYGVGPQTRQHDEAGYTSRYGFGRLALGVNFLEAWRLSAGVHYKQFNTAPTIVDGVVDLHQRYPGVPGFNGSDSVTQEVQLLWDTRDFPTTPSRGQSGELVLEKTNRGWGSDTDFLRYWVEGKQFFPWTDSGQTTVVRARFEKVNGSYIPFEELATLGGRQNFRGFGQGRFSDRGSLVANFEHRIPLASISLMDIDTRMEIAPFLDVGTVFPNIEGIERRYIRTVEGLSFRAVFKPNVVGDIEVGLGNEGPAVFVDLDYPF
jgi:hypothetical protein